MAKRTLSSFLAVILLLTTTLHAQSSAEAQCAANRSADIQYEQNLYGACVANGYNAGGACDASFVAQMALIETEYGLCMVWAWLQG